MSITLFDWPAGPGLTRAGSIEVLGVACDFGNAYVSGARLGPAAIRAASAQSMRPLRQGRDLGDIAVADGADWPGIVARTRAAVDAIVSAAAIPLVLGGDHAVSFGAVAAVAAQGPIDVVWFDAHTDFCPWSADEPHNHKQVLRRIAGLEQVRRMLVIGHRGLTYFDESTQARTLDVCAISEGRPVLPHDWASPGRPIYLSVDVDVLDPTLAPGTGHPVPGGLDVETVCTLIRSIAAHRTIAGLDLTEVNPMLDHQAATARAAATILAAAADAATSSIGVTRHSHPGVIA
jgi:agmatinase